ncbi:MAG: hypothetical protein HN413_17735 [Chloroflexi bacterium]|jgi:hypothetical protein|nr:hypothetical protein [Chloroflexota bacterium]
MSEKLFRIAVAIYKEQLPPMNIWVMLPQGLIMGQLTSKKEMAKDIRRNIKEQEKENPIEPAVKSVSYKFTYGDLTNDYPEAEEEKTITLKDVNIHTYDVELHSPFAHIDATKITAWGLGSHNH